jgi:hypothetical protein
VGSVELGALREDAVDGPVGVVDGVQVAVGADLEIGHRAELKPMRSVFASV